jgi:hypothetical protein
MVESGESVPALSIGMILGNTPESWPWKSELRPLSIAIRQRAAGVISPLAVNVVFIVPGDSLPDEFDGLRTGTYSRSKGILMVQVALNRSAGPPSEETVRRLLSDAVDLAEEFARRRKIAPSLPELRAIVDSI